MAVARRADVGKRQGPPRRWAVAACVVAAACAAVAAVVLTSSGAPLSGAAPRVGVMPPARTLEEEELGGGALRFSAAGAGAVTVAEGLAMLAAGGALERATLRALEGAARRMGAFFWEFPPFAAPRRGPGGGRFEFVLTPAPALEGVAADEGAFAEHLRRACGAGGVAAFDNLGGDARLVAPCSAPGADAGAYAHAAAFFARAPAGQRSALLRAAAREALREVERAGGAPRWLSTSGLGVSWLHVRVDARPKYYVHRAYAQWGQ